MYLYKVIFITVMYHVIFVPVSEIEVLSSCKYQDLNELYNNTYAD